MGMGSSSGSSSERQRKTTDDVSLLFNVANSVKAHRTSIALIVLIVMVAAVGHHYLFPRYTARAVLLIQRAENSPLQALMGRMTGQAVGSTSNEYLAKYVQYLNSHEFFLQAARKYRQVTPQTETQPTKRTSLFSWLRSAFGSLMYVKLVDPSATANEIEGLATSLNSSAVFLKSGKDNLAVRVRGSDYKDVVEKANFLAATAVETITESELKELNDAKEFINSEEQTSLDRLRNIDHSLISFRKQNKLVRSDSKGGELLEKVASISQNLQRNQLEYKQNEKLISQLNEELRNQETQLFTKGASSLKSTGVIAQMRQQMEALRYKRMLLQAQGQVDSDSQISRLNQQIDELANRLKERIRLTGGTEEDIASLLMNDREGVVRQLSRLKRENQYLKTSIDTLQTELQLVQDSLKALPAAQQKIAGLLRNSEIELQLLEEMKKKILEIELERVALSSKVRLLEKATIAGIPARFNALPKAVFSGLIACVLAILFFAGLDELGNTIKSARELSNLGLINVGSVPWVRASSRWRWLLPQSRAVDVVQPWKNNTESAEVLAMKHVRAMVHKMRSPEGEQSKVISVLGATAGDGKSFVSSNLAMALAQQGHKTLLLDGDLRRSTVASAMGVSKRFGLTSLLQEKTKDPDQAINHGVLDNFDVLTAGPHVRNPTELLDKDKFKRLLVELRKSYEYIVIDTPPLLPIVDGLTLSSLSDSIIFAVSHRKTKLHDLRQAVERLRQHFSRPVFAVYNRVIEASQYDYLYTATGGLGSSKNLKMREELKRLKDSLRKGESEKGYV